MAARPAGANAPAFKIKLKPRKDTVPVSTTSQNENHNGSSPQQAGVLHNKSSSIQQLTEEGREDGHNKRKCSSPAASPVPKKTRREETPEPVLIEHASSGSEIFSDKSEKMLADPRVTKHRLRHYNPLIVSLIQKEQVRVDDEDSRTNRLKISTTSLENISHGQLQVISVIPSSIISPGLSHDEMGQNDSTIRASLDATVGQTYPFSSWARPNPRPCRNHDIAVIPTHASWFAWDRIHKLERQAMPQLFYGKSKLQSTETFIQARNAIIRKYRSKPQMRITFPDIQGIANLPDKDLAQILEFLVQWGLVNYQIEISESPGFKYPFKVPVYLTEDASGALSISEISSNPLEYLYQYDPLQVPAMALKSLVMHEESSTVIAENMVKESSIRSSGGNSGHTCTACSRDCSQHYFYCERQGDYILCSDCYADGKLGIGMTVTEFVLSDGHSAEAVDGYDNANWNDQETLMLLEALEIYGDNWSEVSEFVGTKSKAQCISHFIGLSIEDTFLEDMEVPRSFTTVKTKQPVYSSNGEACSSSSIDLESRAPDGLEQINFVELQGEPELHVAFEGASNPVMSLVAFLSATVGPRVAAVAAHAALASLSEEYQATQSTVHGQDQNGGITTGLSTTVATANGDIAPGKNVQKDGHHFHLSMQSMRKITSSALAMAAMKAKLLADQEEREVQRLGAIVVDNQLKKLNIKLKHIGDIDMLFEKEREQMERNRHRLAAERVRFINSRIGSTSNPQTPVPANSNVRPAGPVAVSAVPPVVPTAPIIPQGAVHPSQILRPAMYPIGPGGMPVLDSM